MVTKSNSFQNAIALTGIAAPDKAKAWRVDVDSSSPEFIEAVKAEIGQSYMPLTEFENLFKAGGMVPVYDELRKSHFPLDEKTKKGNFGEILAQLHAKHVLGFEIPVPKLRFRTSRERSQHGEDVVAFKFQEGKPDILLLVEAKYRATQVPAGIVAAYDTIERSVVNASQCYLLNFVLSILEAQGDIVRYRRVRAMLNDYSGGKFVKLGCIFVVTGPKAWKDSAFKDNITSNRVDPLHCWAYLSKDPDAFLDACH